MRKPSAKDRLLYCLREAGERGITTGEILQAGIGSRYGARVLELREQGYVIQAERIRDGAWRYKLLDEPLSGREVAEDSAAMRGGAESPPQTSRPESSLFDLPAVSQTRSAITGDQL